MTFNIITVKIYVFVDLLLVVVIIHATEFKVKELEIGASGKIPCELFENNADAHLVQWYKSRRTNEFENGDSSLASWTKRESASQPNYHMENNTFSLVIDKTTWEDEGIYKCSVVREDSLIRSSYYIRTFMYALPRMDPKITLDPALHRVNCTVEHVKPLLYPVFNFDCSNAHTETYAVLNEDGTYTTSVNCTLPQNKSTSRVDCSFSYLHYNGVGTLELSDITTDSLVENRRTTLSPMSTSVTFAGDGCRTIDHNAIIGAGIVIGFMTVIICIMFRMLIRKCPLKRIWIRDVQNCNKAEESEENMFKPAMTVS